MHNGKDPNPAFIDPVDDPVGVLEQFPDRLITVFRDLGPQPWELSQDLGSSRDAVDHAPRVLAGTLRDRVVDAA